MHILIAESEDFSEEAKAVLSEFASLDFAQGEREEVLSKIKDCDAVFIRLKNKIDDAFFSTAAQLKFICTPTTGLNHIDLKKADEHNVQVLSLKGETEFLNNITATSEHTWALLLALLRHLPEASKSVLDGQWNRNLFRGHDLKGKTIGIVGYGRLGKIIAEYAKTFRMTVLVSDPHVAKEDCPFKLLPLHEVLRQSDVVSLHVNLDEQTQGFFAEPEFTAMKKDSVLINTSRGELIDERAFLQALESKKLLGAAIDVVAGETGENTDWLKKHPLWDYAKKHHNLIITPHIGGASFESMAATEVFIAQKLRQAIMSDKNKVALGE
ncbi:MAG: hydroxyacid dehydrogenase [Deltaproteobacteria bacterium]|nr:hydroxyacid dehydrogenase [Deltaproteobacteria bacterium]